MLYQNTPRASKNNAFCWLTWEAQIQWVSKQQAAQQAKVRDELQTGGLHSASNLYRRRTGVSIDPRPQASADKTQIIRRGGL